MLVTPATAFALASSILCGTDPSTGALLRFSNYYRFEALD
jgi:hypothetical protein